MNFILIETPEPERLHFPFVAHQNKPGYPVNWSKVSWLLRNKAGNRCEWCGSSDRLNVHHMGVPYPNGKPGDRRDKHDLRRENLYVLCGQCHQWIEQLLAEEERRERRRQKRKRQRQRKKQRKQALSSI